MHRLYGMYLMVFYISTLCHTYISISLSKMRKRSKDCHTAGAVFSNFYGQRNWFLRIDSLGRNQFRRGINTCWRIDFHSTPHSSLNWEGQGFLKINILWAIGDSIPNSVPTPCQKSIFPLLQSLKIQPLTSLKTH